MLGIHKTEAISPSFPPCRFQNQISHQGSPASLVAGSKTQPAFSMEILVKEDEILPVRIFLKPLSGPIDRPFTLIMRKEEAPQPMDYSGMGK